MLTVSATILLQVWTSETQLTDGIQELQSPLAEVSHTASHSLVFGLQ
jgi:hypothetical protein